MNIENMIVFLQETLEQKNKIDNYLGENSKNIIISTNLEGVKFLALLKVPMKFQPSSTDENISIQRTLFDWGYSWNGNFKIIPYQTYLYTTNYKYLHESSSFSAFKENPCTKTFDESENIFVRII